MSPDISIIQGCGLFFPLPQHLTKKINCVKDNKQIIENMRRTCNK